MLAMPVFRPAITKGEHKSGFDVQSMFSAGWAIRQAFDTGQDAVIYSPSPHG